jgi:hypothetical protein
MDGFALSNASRNSYYLMYVDLYQRAKFERIIQCIYIIRIGVCVRAHCTEQKLKNCKKEKPGNLPSKLDHTSSHLHNDTQQTASVRIASHDVCLPRYHGAHSHGRDR